MHILQKIVETKKEEVALKRKQGQSWREQAYAMPESPSFLKALSGEGIHIIAEVKKASPSAGIISPDFDHLKQARFYQDAGADAISVLTDVQYFQGSTKFLKQISEEVDLPLLCKDFIIDPIQIYEARVNGASAFLLIAAILSAEQLSEYMDIARQLGMDTLVETHDAEELDMAVTAGANIIGVNNRNLKTFEVSLDRSKQLIKKLDTSLNNVLVSESGIKTAADITQLHASGFTTFLVGETLMRGDISIASLKGES